MDISKKQILEFIKNGNVYILRDLKKLGCDFTDYEYIKCAVVYDNIEVVEFLIDSGCVPDKKLLMNVTSPRLYTLLYEANLKNSQDVLMNIEVCKQEIIDLKSKMNKKIDTVLEALEEFKKYSVCIDTSLVKN